MTRRVEFTLSIFIEDEKVSKGRRKAVDSEGFR